MSSHLRDHPHGREISYFQKQQTPLAHSLIFVLLPLLANSLFCYYQRLYLAMDPAIIVLARPRLAG